MKPILTQSELTLLTEYGTWMQALSFGKIKPLNDKQKQFCTDLKLNQPPNEKYANIFWKFLKRLELVQNNELDNRKRIMVKDDREDWKKIRKMRF